ncbi:hypothetical protein CPB83DRAFT_79933 [Crepidotus variabilis]|uniref:HECT-type E3 ubiquitin transferase n=1 Tax=Crepidotus variabilis TaxID=179855 RepID=A0A9P6JST8_9AGAR|nr:hypothetical protein CPB83DRAFT_79933 [Crepidotus variabilis]
MKIQPKSKKAIPPPPAVSELISNLLSYSDERLAAFLKQIDAWKWPRSDLNAWIKVLNKFDDIMDAIIREYNVEKLQLLEFKDSTKELLSQILRFERLLLENSTNRKTFNSYDRLNSLLSASDLDVVILALNVLLRPSQQYSSQPAVSHALSISTARLQSLAKRWSNLRENGIGLVELASSKREDVEGVPAEAREASLTFYRTDTPMTVTEQKPEDSPEVSPATPRKLPTAAAVPAPASNAVQVRLDEQTILAQPVMSVLSDAIKTQSIPESETFELLCRIRAAACLSSGKKADREKLLIVRLLAIAIYGHTHSESQATSALFLYEPDLVAHISELLQVDQDIPISVQTAAIAALDALARYKNKLQEVLTAVNAGVNHGVLLALVRNMVVEVINPQSTLPQSFVEALLAFLTYLASHASGGNMVVSAGLIPLLIQIIESRNPKRLPVISKTMQLLDNVIYTFTNAFSLFTASRGIEILVERIEYEIDTDVKEFATGYQPCALSGLGELPTQRTAVLKHILRSMHRMMQSSGTAEGLRGLIDTSLLKSIKKILEYRGLFGPNIFPLAINVMSTFVHNEPTSLAIIQEAGLPNLFYRAIEIGIEPAIEVIQALPNAIGALCLNEAGQAQLANRPSILPSIISLFTSDKHLKVLIDKENAVVIGSAVDELIRHHPLLKLPVFEALKSTLAHIEALGAAYRPPSEIKQWYQIVPQEQAGDSDVSMQDSPPVEPEPATAGASSIEQDEDEPQEKTHDNLIVNYIDVLGRFLEGFFQHPHHCKDFVLNTDGLQRIGRITALPCLPYDFANSVASDSMVQVLRTMTEVATNETLVHLTEIVRTSLDDSKFFWETVHEESRLLSFVELSELDDEALSNQQFRSLVTLHIRITLLSDVFATAGQSQGRTAIGLLQTLLNNAPRQVLVDLGALHRASTWENITLHRGLSLKGIETTSSPSIPVDDGHGLGSSISSAVDGTNPPPVSANGVNPQAPSSATGPASQPSRSETPRDWNASALKHITQGLPNALAPFFQAMVKMFHARRNPDSVQKKQILESSKIVAQIMVDHLDLQDFKDRGSLFNYYSAMLELFVLLLIDERTATNTLHTVAIVAFYRANGFQRVFEICVTLVSTIDELINVPEHTRSDAQKKDLLHAYGAVKFAMHLIHPIISSKPLFESGQTILITSRDKKYTDADFFEPHDFLVKLRLAALPVVRRLWDSEWIVQAPLGVSRYVVRCVLEIANGENEESKGDPNAGGLLPPAVPRSHSPTEAQIRMLTDMGFPRSAVERALARTHNDVNTATELLLSQPFPMAPDPPQPAVVVPDPPTDTRDEDENMEAEEEPEPTPEPTVQAEDNPTPSSDAASSEADTSTAVPIGKTAEQWRTELNEAREPLKMNISRQSLRLIDEHLSLLFDLHIAFTKSSGHQQQAICNLVEDVNTFSPNAYDVQEQPLANRCRLLALVLCETPSSLESDIRNTLMDHLLALLLSTKDVEHPPKWLAAHLLVTEALLTLADEPRSIPAPQEGESVTPVPIAVGPSRSEARSTVFEFCLKLLGNEDLPADELLSVLRLFVLLTRDREMATQFVDRDGLTLLFRRLKKSSVTGGSSYIASILRHIVEDSSTIQVIMQQTIKRYFNQPRTRMVDLTTYVRNCSAIALRDVSTFIDVTNNLCQVENPFSSSPLIKLQTNDSTENEKAVAGNESEPTIEMQVDNPPATSSSIPQKPVETAIHLLMSELMNIVKDTSDAPQLPSTPRDNITQEDAMGVETQSGSNSNEANITSPDGQDKNQYVCFVMQCLTELLFSYDACKIAFLSYSSKKRPQQSQPKEPTSKFRTTTLNFILSELITYGTINPASDSKHRSRGALCSWAMNVVGALCVDTSAAQDMKDVSSDLLLVRKFVLETISKALKEVSSSTASTEARYGRLLALADLCHRLLIVRVNPSTRKQQQEDVPTHLAKIMLEKNYVATLTNALSEVDLNYPNVRNLVASILRPLEFLTKIAIKMSKASGKGKDEVRQDEVEPSTSDDDDEVMDDGNAREETPDLYRNSALGMYGGEMDDRQYSDDEEMADSEDEQDVEMDYGDETGSEDTSASESESEEEDLLDEATGNVGERWEEGDEDEDEDLVENTNDEDDDDDDDNEPDQDVDEEADPDVEDDDDDDDEEGGMMWEDVQQPEGLGMLLHNVDDEPGLGVPIQVNHEDDEPDLGSEEEFLMDQGHINPEGLIDFGHAVLSGGLFLQRRHRSAAEQHSLVRPRNTPSAPETITHPLLLDITTQNRSNVGPQSRVFRTAPRIIGGAPPDLAQAIDDMLQEGGLQAVHQIIHHEGGEMFHIQVPISTMLHPSRRFIGGSARPDRTPRTSTHRQGREFDPLLTLQRWAEEMKILHGDFVVERVSRLTNHLLIAMLPTALEVQKQAKIKAEAAEAKRKAEEAEKELEEAKKKEEGEAQQKEAAGLKKALEEAIQKASESNQMQEAHPLQNPTADETSPSPGNQEANLQSSGDTPNPQTSDPAAPPVTQGDSVEDSAMEETPGTAPDQDTEMTDASASSSIPANVESASSSAETSEPTPGASSEPVERVTVIIHGSAVDITDTGIDPTFLEALPDDMREEVINQHVRDQQASRVERPPDSQISTEFLDALPPDIRAEIIQQEAMERARRRTEESNRGPPREAAEIDPASFIASLDPTLRQAVLMEQDETFLQTLPSHMIAEVGAYRDEVQARRAHVRNPIRPIPTAIPQIKKYTPTHDAIMLLDRTGISVLVRLLFYPQVLKKTLLFRVLVNLCENMKSRTELFTLLLGILQDGTGDLMAVDKSFAQLSVRNRESKPPTPKAAGKQKAVEPASVSPWTLGNSQMETVPDLIAQRCLEALTYIVNANDASSIFFLTEHEVPIGLRRTVGKKGKGKEKHLAGPHYPLVLLLNLLDRQSLLRTPAILESVVGLLATITRPLISLKDQDKSVDAETMLPPASLSTNSATIESSTSTSQPNPEPGQEPNTATITPETIQPAAIAGSSSTDQPTSDKQDKKTATTEEKSLLPYPPQVPHSALRLIVNILTTGECSSRTFQQSLALIQHLSFIPDARDIIALELKTKAQECGQVLYADLDELAVALQDNQSQTITSSVAGKFSPASSTQAKLLRVLKTIDYMYTPKAPPTNPLAPATTSNEDVEKVQAIYESFRFTPLWRRLGDCLSSIGENSETEHIATVLLPLIEALMVVCKFVGSKGTLSRLARAASISSPRSPTTPKESMEDLFITFTDAHRKLLNLMVRNNPSLMSGSFSLLVNNSRVLDFDNKRNYFNQQLHRQPHARERHGTLQLNVRRARVFEDSFLYLQRKTGEQIKHGKLSVRFYDEEGVDAGGLTREWFQILARQMFNPDYALFQPCAADKLTYQPNKASWVNPEHLSFFKFVGRVIGKAIYDGRLLDAYFARSLYRQILCKPVDYRDVEWVDPEYYNSLCWILENDPTVLDLTFSVEGDEFGVNKIVALKEDGEQLQVTNENKREYVQLSAQYRLYSSIKEQIENLLKGFYEIIPKDLITIFNEQELELLISGTPDVDVDEWRAATEYNGYTGSDPNIVWWWRALKSFNREERAKVLSFATGTSRVPLNGFLDLQGVQGVQKFSIHRAYGEPDRLPQAHTCFNQIDLPPYTSYEMLRQQLLLAINEGGEGFAFS